MNRIIRLFAVSTCLLMISVPAAHPGSACAKSLAGEKVNVRSGPSLKSGVVFRAPLGYPIKVEKEEGEWVFFRDWQNNKGWVYKPLVSDIETAVILVERANVRSSAGKRHRVVARAERGEIYKVLARNGKWVQLGYYFDDQSLGWVRSDLVFGD